MNKPKCPGCQQSDTSIVEGQRAVCKSCSKTKRCVFQFCSACQREWPHDAPPNSSCTLPNCALRAALLSVELRNDPESSVYGCPYFRACPGCKALLTHSGDGCPYITCPQCNEEFCFRCLRSECSTEYGDDYVYDSDNDDDDDDDVSEIETCVIVDNSQYLRDLGL